MEIEDVEDKDVMTCEKNDTSDLPQQQSKRRLKQQEKRIRIKKKSKSKFAGLIVKGVPSLWFEVEIDVVSIVDDMKQSKMFVNCLSKCNIFVINYQLNLLFTNYLWLQFKVKYDFSLTECITKKEMEIDTRSIKYFG